MDGIWGVERDVQRAARDLGVDLSGSWLLLLMAHPDARSDERLEGSAFALEAAIPDLLAGPLHRLPTPHVPFFLGAGDDEALSSQLDVASKVAVEFGVLVLVSDAVASWMALPAVYPQEAAAIACARAAGRSSGVVRARDISLHRLLQRIPVDARVDYAREVLKPVEALKPPKTDEAIATLEAYFRGSGRLDETAAELELHRNSYRYRLERAQTLLGVDLRLGSDRMGVHLALAARRLVEEEARLLDDPTPFGSATGPEGAELGP